MKIIAIDTGIRGAIGISSDNKKSFKDSLEIILLPKAKNKSLQNYTSAKHLIEILKTICFNHPEHKIIVEQVNPYVGGKKSVFGFGINFSAVIQSLEILDLNYETVDPYEGWQKKIWLPQDMVYSYNISSNRQKRETKITTYKSICRQWGKDFVNDKVNFKVTKKGPVFHDGKVDVIGMLTSKINPT